MRVANVRAYRLDVPVVHLLVRALAVLERVGLGRKAEHRGREAGVLVWVAKAWQQSIQAHVSSREGRLVCASAAARLCAAEVHGWHGWHALESCGLLSLVELESCERQLTLAPV